MQYSACATHAQDCLWVVIFLFSSVVNTAELARYGTVASNIYSSVPLVKRWVERRYALTEITKEPTISSKDKNEVAF